MSPPTSLSSLNAVAAVAEFNSNVGSHDFIAPFNINPASSSDVSNIGSSTSLFNASMALAAAAASVSPSFYPHSVTKQSMATTATTHHINALSHNNSRRPVHDMSR